MNSPRETYESHEISLLIHHKEVNAENKEVNAGHKQIQKLQYVQVLSLSYFKLNSVKNMF